MKDAILKTSAMASVALLFAIPSARLGYGAPETMQPRFVVLVFSKTNGFRHESIPKAIAAIRALGAEHGFEIDASEDAAQFTDATLSKYRVVLFLNTTGTILTRDEKAAFQRFIRGGGGFVGVHSASDTEYDWPWYGRLVGAYFKNHPQIQPATVRVDDGAHPSTRSVPPSWRRTDEWYNFRSNPRFSAHVLATLDETSYAGGTMGSDHPISWCQDFDGGRSWYTALGHTEESYGDPTFIGHLLGGIQSAARVYDADCSVGHAKERP
jgi:type 1 glutamine amidotransferase